MVNIIQTRRATNVAVPYAPDGRRGSRINAAYEAQLQREQDAFTNLVDVHALPDIFHYWANKFLLPKLNAYGLSGMDEFFVKFMEEACLGRSEEHTAFISLGAGNCDTEIRLAKALLTAGITNFHIECQDINDAMLARGVQMSIEEGLEQYIRPVKADFNTWIPEKSYDGVLANQSLHHVLELEHLFDQVAACLPPHGKFIISDMIGRNGHQRWPEALEIVHQFWRELPTRYRYNHLLQRHEKMYENWDCSTEGFEGVRAQDILPLLNTRFHYQLFFAFSNIIDIFIDRCFGHNFSPEKEWDRQFIDRVEAIDDASIVAGKVKPTHMMAVLSTDPATEMLVHSHLTPEFCVRWPDPE